MALLVAQDIDRSGLNPVLSASDVAGDEFVNTGKEFIVIDNASGSPVSVTLDIQATVDSQAVTDRVVSVPAGEQRYIGPFKPSIYNDGDSHMNVSYSAVTSLTTGIIRLTAEP
jgi:hypothetical protein